MEESRPAQDDSHVTVLRPLMAGPNIQGKNVSMSWLKMLEGYEETETGKCNACIPRRRDCRGGVPCSFCVTDHGLTAAYAICSYPSQAVPVNNTVEKPRIITAGPSDEPRKRNRTSETEKRRAGTLAGINEIIASGATFRTDTEVDIKRTRRKTIDHPSAGSEDQLMNTPRDDETPIQTEMDVDMDTGDAIDEPETIQDNAQSNKRPAMGDELYSQPAKRTRVSSPSSMIFGINKNSSGASHSFSPVKNAMTESSGSGEASGSGSGNTGHASGQTDMGFIRSRLAKGSLPAYPLAWQSQRGKPATSTFYDGFAKIYLDLDDPKIPSIKARFINELEADRARWNLGEFKGKVAEAYAFQTEKTFKEDLGRE